MSKVSIIIPVFNQAALTRQCLQSVSETCPSAGVQIIVIDNGSTDQTADLLKPRQSSTFQFVQNDHNRGFGYACNQGAALARGDFLLFLNNDTEPRGGWLEALLSLAETQPDIGAVGAKLLWPDHRLQEAGAIILPDGSTVHIGNYEDPDSPAFNRSYDVNYCSAACLMVRRDTFHATGGFDSMYSPAYGEDADLCLKIWRHGQRVVYQPAAVVIHHESATSRNVQDINWISVKEANRVNFSRKWASTIQSFPLPERVDGKLIYRTPDNKTIDCGLWYFIGNDFELRRRLDSLQRELRQNHTQRLAIYGAGQHTQRLLRITSGNPLNIVCILDDSPASTTLGGLPVITPANLNPRDIDAILVSSDTRESLLTDKARSAVHDSLPVFTLYQSTRHSIGPV